MIVDANIVNNPNVRKRIHLSSEQLQELFGHLTQRIQTAPAASYKQYFSKALALALHEEDAHYFALALLIGVPIWTNDKGFKKQAKVKVYSTFELVEILASR